MQEIKVIVAQLKTLERNIDQLIVDCERVKAESDKLKKEKSLKRKIQKFQMYI